MIWVLSEAFKGELQFNGDSLKQGAGSCFLFIHGNKERRRRIRWNQQNCGLGIYVIKVLDCDITKLLCRSFGFYVLRYTTYWPKQWKTCFEMVHLCNFTPNTHHLAAWQRNHSITQPYIVLRAHCNYTGSKVLILVPNMDSAHLCSVRSQNRFQTSHFWWQSITFSQNYFIFQCIHTSVLCTFAFSRPHTQTNRPPCVHIA